MTDKNTRFSIISASNCTYCEKAMDLLDTKGLDYEVRSVGGRPWLRTIMSMANLTTVPQVFRPDGQHIGGYRELRKYLDADNRA